MTLACVVDAMEGVPPVEPSRLARKRGLTRRLLAKRDSLPSGSEKGCTVAIVICDSGLKYLTTDLWEM